MRISRKQLKKIISDAIDLDLQNGDVILTGRFKNKRTIVKDIGKDDLGQPTVNGMKALAFRVEKLMPKDKWSAESKKESEEVNEMKITRRQLRRIIREFSNVSSMEIELYLKDIAASARADRLSPESIKLLLQDEFMDNFGAYKDISDYEDVINDLAFGLI